MFKFVEKNCFILRKKDYDIQMRGDGGSRVTWGKMKHVTYFLYDVVSESSRTVTVVTASVKEEERGGQSYTFTSLLHQSAT
jgi:hypothetical protein